MTDTPETLTEDEIKAALPELFRRSQIDLAFRTLCLENPGEALRRLTGKALPEGIDLRFLDEDQA